MSDVLIRQVGKDTIDQQVSVFARSFGHGESDANSESAWIQKHYRNPSGDSVIFGAFSDGKMVGINAFMPMEYRFNNRILKVVQSCDSGVDPDFRRRGIWGGIMKRAMEHFARETSFDAMIGFPNYHNSYPGFLKLGWKSVLSLRNLVMINSGQAIAERRLPAALAPIGNVAAIQKIPAKLIARPLGQYEAEQAPKADCILPYRNGTLALNFSHDWLDWKMSYQGLRNYAVSHEGKRIADFIFQESQVDGLKYLKFIVDFSYADEKTCRAAFAACLLSFSKRKEIAMVRLMCANPSQYRGLGFLKIRSHYNPFIAYPLNPDWKDTVLNPSAWKIGALDLD